MITGIRLIVILNYRRKRAIRETESENAYDHHYRAEGAFEVVSAANVTVADCCDGGYSPVEWYGIQILGRVLAVRLFEWLHPRPVERLFYLIQRCNDDPQAAANVGQNQKNEYEEKHALESKADFQEFV